MLRIADGRGSTLFTGYDGRANSASLWNRCLHQLFATSRRTKRQWRPEEILLHGENRAWSRRGCLRHVSLRRREGVWSKRQGPVKVTFEGVAYSGSLVQCGGQQHMVGILKTIRETNW